MSLPSVSDYTFVAKLGSGSYATVYKAFKKDGCREIVAIKRIDALPLSNSAIDRLLTEIKLLKVLKHEHIVEMKDFFREERHIYIVMEYCDGGDVAHLIKRKHRLPERTCKTLLHQLALALKYMRDHNVCHMDLKPHNLLLNKKPQLMLKVADFGCAQYLSNSEQKFAIRGSPLYMAPEILLKHEYDARVDLWSIGVILYECLFGRAPYSSNSTGELIEKIKDDRPIKLPQDARISAECKDLLLSLLQRDPAKRITFDQFFAHKFLVLDHPPTKGDYDKLVELMQKAVKMDTEKRTKEAFDLYCEGIELFIPLLKNETDPNRKEFLKLYVDSCVKRAEILKASFINNGGKNAQYPRTESTESGSSLDGRTFNKNSESMANILETGEVAEQRVREGSTWAGKTSREVGDSVHRVPEWCVIQ